MSELDTQEILKAVTNVTNIKEKRKLIPATRYLTYRERQGLEAEAKRVKEQLEYRGPGAGSQEQKRDARKYLDHVEDKIEGGTPPPLNDDQKVALDKYISWAEEQIINGGTSGVKMQTCEEYRRNDVGSVDRYKKWSAGVKNIILGWKNAKRARHPDSDDQDLANVEQLRPSSATSGVTATSSFMPEAQIPGHFAMTPLAKQNWPEGLTEYPDSSPLMQAALRELAELREQYAVLNSRIAEDDAKKAEHRERTMKGLEKARAARRKKEDKIMQKEIDRLKKESGEKETAVG